MNIDHILHTFNTFQVDYLLIGGMNFLLQHEPVLTYDIDFWIHDIRGNLDRCHAALVQLDAAWGPSEADLPPLNEATPEARLLGVGVRSMPYFPASFLRPDQPGA